MSKKSVTIGIPAFNESANIGHLLHDLFMQKQNSFTLKGIIISSDGSSDNTVSICKNFKSNKVIVLDNADRRGASYRQNQIIELVKSDVLVLLNADILIKDIFFIEKLIKPIINGKADLTSSAIQPLHANTFMEKVLNVSIDVKNLCFEKINNGMNIYTCHGVARAFSKKLYSDIRFAQSIGEDAYSYLYCVVNSFKYIYCKDAVAFIKSPDNFEDHKKQSLRFFQSKKTFTQEFGEDFVEKQYHYSFKTMLLSVLQFFRKKPIHLIAYLLIFGFLKLLSFNFKKSEETWSISTSSKVLRA